MRRVCCIRKGKEGERSGANARTHDPSFRQHRLNRSRGIRSHGLSILQRSHRRSSGGHLCEHPAMYGLARRPAAGPLPLSNTNRPLLRAGSAGDHRGVRPRRRVHDHDYRSRLPSSGGRVRLKGRGIGRQALMPWRVARGFCSSSSFILSITPPSPPTSSRVRCTSRS